MIIETALAPYNAQERISKISSYSSSWADKIRPTIRFTWDVTIHQNFTYKPVVAAHNM